MKTIHKYPLALTSGQPVKMPQGAVILSAKLQGETLCIWAEVETSNPTAVRCFEVFGTGHVLFEDMGIERKFIDTVIDGDYVWHVYENTTGF